MVAVALPRVRPPVVVLAAVAAVWLAVVAAQVTGRGHLVHLGHHDTLIEGARPLWAALVAFVAVWVLMIVAMMLPSALSMIGLHATASAAHARPGAARAAFLAGYVTVWTVFGAVAFAGDAALHRVVGASSWLSARPWLVVGALLAGAGVAQFLPLTQACLRSCRHPYAYLLTRFRPGARAGFRLGRDHGLYCLGCCWALMLVMFAAGLADLVWMAALTGVMVYEKIGRRGEHVAAAVGVVLVGWGGIVMLHPSWVPVGLAGGGGA
jgi:predicted metal-binding membrane protein